MLARIRGVADADAEMREIEASVSHTDERGRLSDLFAASVRPALVVGVGLAILQQITGINTVIYYAPIIMQSAGIPSASGAILATAGIGVVNVLMTIVSMWLIDRVGRRPLLLTGIAGMAISLGALGMASGRHSLHRIHMDRSDQRDGLCGVICNQFGPDFLAADRGDLSAEDSPLG